ncbi:MAG: APC family permease [Thermoplasmatota archaeon]
MRHASSPAPSHASPQLKRNLTLFDATALALGAIIGAGIFVISGVATGLAGPGVVLSIVIAGGVAAFTAYGYVKLSVKYPEEGSIYAFATHAMTRRVGFVAGWLWIFENVVAGATVSLGLATYARVLLPVLPLLPVAWAAVIILGVLNFVGLKQSSILNGALVTLKLSVLALFIALGFVHFNGGLYHPFLPQGWTGVLKGSALVFFAFIGFGRATTAAEEIQDPERTLPRSIVTALVLAGIVYVLVGVVTAGILPYQDLGASASPLAQAADQGIHLHWLAILVSVAAVAATTSVLLTTLIGVSRVTYAMARAGELPRAFARLHRRFDTPYLAVTVTATAMLVVSMAGNLQGIAGITNFGSLAVYGIVNLSALLVMRRSKAWFAVTVALLGFLSCAALLLFLPPVAWAVGSAWILTGLAYDRIWNRKTRRAA